MAVLNGVRDHSALLPGVVDVDIAFVLQHDKGSP